MGAVAERASPKSVDAHLDLKGDGMSAGAEYLWATYTLANGSVIHVRPIQASDMESLRAFHSRLSDATILFRYFGPMPMLTGDQVRRLTHIDYDRRMALIATIGSGSGEQIVAIVRYEPMGPYRAEAAFVVEDRWQGMGIAKLLFHPLAAYARERGFTTLVANIMTNNARMLHLLQHAGYPCTALYESGCIELSLDISAPPAAHHGTYGGEMDHAVPGSEHTPHQG